VRLKISRQTQKMVDCAGVFVAIGHVPSTQIFRGMIDMDETG